jgi:2,3-bisphosphoglycerate-dependent phosphoglycerate mutase
METQVYLIRHGETMWNRQKRIQGHRNIPLSQEGVRQAEKLAAAMKDTSLDAIYSSDLDRAVQTARFIAEGKGLSVTQIPELRERHFGQWEGCTLDEIQEQYPLQWREVWQKGGAYDIEPFEHTRNRMLNQVQQLVERHPGGTIAVVSHGGSINAVLDVLTEGEYGPGKHRLGNTSVTRLAYHPKRGWSVIQVNCTAHLTESSQTALQRRH